MLRLSEEFGMNRLPQTEGDDQCNPVTGWSEGYFDETVGILAGETFERPPQGELPDRDE